MIRALIAAVIIALAGFGFALSQKMSQSRAIHAGNAVFEEIQRLGPHGLSPTSRRPAAEVAGGCDEVGSEIDLAVRATELCSIAVEGRGSITDLRRACSLATQVNRSASDRWMEVTSAARTPEVEACRTRLASRGERLVRAFDYQIALQTVSLKGGDKPAPFSLDR